MGRTVPSFRMAIEQEQRRWERAARPLPANLRASLTEVLRSSTMMASAASMCASSSLFEALMICAMFDTYQRRKPQS